MSVVIEATERFAAMFKFDSLANPSSSSIAHIVRTLKPQVLHKKLDLKLLRHLEENDRGRLDVDRGVLVERSSDGDKRAKGAEECAFVGERPA